MMRPKDITPEDLDVLPDGIQPRIDWHDLWTKEAGEDWIVEPLIAERRLVALYSPAKLGKSLLMLELGVAMSRGTPVLGTKIARPYSTLYVDLENDPRGDVRPRLEAMGYGPDDLPNLSYLSFPWLAALDSEQGGQQLLANAKYYGCEVVVIDTVSRTVEGEENNNDTWLNFYKRTGLLLKRAGIALVRLDHTGKDESKGMRGGSAKYSDLDAVWRLSEVVRDHVFRLECTDKRMQIAELSLTLHRETEPGLQHRVDARGKAGAFDAKVTELTALCDEAQLPNDANRQAVKEVADEDGLRAGSEVLAKVVRERKARVGYV
jgi:AAA domain